MQGRHALIIFEGAQVGGGGGGGGCYLTHSSHNGTYVLFIFSFLFKTFPNALTISWNISIVNEIMMVKVA